MYQQIWEEAISKKNKIAIKNFFDCIAERNQAKSIVKSNPYVMLMDPVGYCNLKCPFCSTGNGSLSRDKQKLSLSTFKHIIDHLGPYLFKLQLYNWGEPLLNKDLPQMVKHVKKHNVVTEISTNLSFPMSEEYAEEIVDSGLDFMLCSIDGASQETYEKYRVGGNFELTMKNMKMLNKKKKEKKLKTPLIIWRFLVFRHNQHEIEKAKKMAKELGVEMKFIRPFVRDDKPEWASTLPEFTPLEHFNPEIQNKDPSDSQQLITISKNKNEKKETFPSTSEKDSNLSNENPKPCTWLWSSITINANSSVSPCCAITEQKNDFGVVEDSIKSVWNNENYRSARAIFNGTTPGPKTICHSCPIPHIQQEMKQHDENIIGHILKTSSPSEQDKIMIFLKENDEELYQKALYFESI